MHQGDQDWLSLSASIAREDHVAAKRYNAHAPSERKLGLSLGPVPFAGAIMTAPVVLLLSHPMEDGRATTHDYAFTRAGWPLSALHPQAPLAPAAWWRARVAALVHHFGAQHLANSIAAVYLTPWHAITLDALLRLPSRQRMLDLAATAAARDAILVVMQGSDLCTEHPDIASLPPARRVRTRSWRGTELSGRNLGDDVWDLICKRIEVHAWL